MTTSKQKYDKKKFVWIGGALYSRKAELSWQTIHIIAEDNSEAHLIIIDTFGERKRIELDNDKLKLRERYQRTYS